MDFKRIQEDVKAEVVKNWRVIAVVAGGIFVLAIIIGLTTKKDEPEVVRQEANRKLDVTRIYINAMDRIDEVQPSILVDMDDEKETRDKESKVKADKKTTKKAKKNNKVESKNEIKAEEASSVVLPQDYKK